MISAVADSCSVRLDKVNGKVYKFHALVFNPDSKGNNKEAYLHRKKITSAPVTRAGILSQQPKTEWKCAYNELLSGIKDLPKQKDDPSSGPIRKRSKTVSQDSFPNESEVSKTDKQKVRFTGVEESSVVEIPKCPTCLQVIAKDTNDFDSLMEKSKEELVSIIMNLNMNLQNRRRKQGYCPSEKDIAQLMQLNISKPDQTAPKTRPARTRRRLNRSKRLTSI